MATGRRQRVRDRIKDAGFDALAQHEVLEAMLYYFIPRKDTAGLGRQLIAEFGSLHAVISATEDALLKVKGMPKHAAFFIANLKNFYERCLADKLTRICVDSPRELQNYLNVAIGYDDTEKVILLMLDAKMKLIRRKILAEGGHNRAQISLKDLSDCVSQTKPAYVIIAHNHPAGSPEPSRDDKEFTKEAHDFLEKLGVRLVEHVIVSDGEVSYSMRDNGHLK